MYTHYGNWASRSRAFGLGLRVQGILQFRDILLFQKGPRDYDGCLSFIQC